MFLRRSAFCARVLLGFFWLGLPLRVSMAQKPVATQSPLWVLPVSSPPTLPGLGKELQRALLGALKEANLNAQPGKSDSDGGISARLEELGTGRFRLTLSHRSGSSQSVGDLEHLDDLVYAVVAELRPKLHSELLPSDPSQIPSLGASKLAALPSPQVVSKQSPTIQTAQFGLGSKEIKLATALLGSSAKSKREPQRTESVVPAQLPPPTPVAMSNSATAPTPPVTSNLPPASTTTNPTTSAAAQTDPEQKPRARPRIAVGVMGEPGSLPPGYFGLGLTGQQALLAFLQQRLQVPAVATRLYSLVGGFEALEQSLRVSARHTLMARLDSLSVTSGIMSGRIHLVLLHDGKLHYDRSVALPPTAVSAAEPPATAFGRAVTSAVESLSNDLLTRL